MGGQGGVLRGVVFFEALADQIGQYDKFVEEGQPKLFNPQIEISDIYTILLSVVVLVALKSMFLSFADYRLFPSMKRSIKKKLFENLFYTMFYVISSVFGLLIISREKWDLNPFTNSDVSMVKALFDPAPPPMSNLFKAYYATQTGYYVGLLVTLFMDSRRSDYNQYLMHHGITLSLMAISFSFGIVRIGLVILILHDICDVFLHAAKTIHYCRVESGSMVFFVLFSAAFVLLRLVIFPRVVVCVGAEVLRYVLEKPGLNNWVAYFDYYLPMWACSVALLIGLYLINCFWMSLISRLIYRELTGSGKVAKDGDIRSDSEDED
ncbi:hypothetical protein NDN08_002931 [Rhodosorus marinus]|uniref:TLC domain-containing protein n=1 Tax=Rhodosorus marinus TaxID=101924 RepID=A0AAV8UV43_9RHOD|nr:hypothetical protein NDN08_002931 [Rhodosorus marinus]